MLSSYHGQVEEEAYRPTHIVCGADSGPIYGEGTGLLRRGIHDIHADGAERSHHFGWDTSDLEDYSPKITEHENFFVNKSSNGHQVGDITSADSTHSRADTCKNEPIFWDSSQSHEDEGVNTKHLNGLCGRNIRMGSHRTRSRREGVPGLNKKKLPFCCEEECCKNDDAFYQVNPKIWTAKSLDEHPYRDPEFWIPRRPLARDRVYHFNVLYNHAKSTLSRTDDTDLALRVTTALVERLELKGYVNSYYHDRDHRPYNTLTTELERVMAGSSVTILLLTPGFLLDCLNPYMDIPVFRQLLFHRRPNRHLIILSVGVPKKQVPAQLGLHDVLYFQHDWELDIPTWSRFDDAVLDNLPAPKWQQDIPSDTLVMKTKSGFEKTHDGAVDDFLQDGTDGRHSSCRDEYETSIYDYNSGREISKETVQQSSLLDPVCSCGQCFRQELDIFASNCADANWSLEDGGNDLNLVDAQKTTSSHDRLNIQSLSVMNFDHSEYSLFDHTSEHRCSINGEHSRTDSPHKKVTSLSSDDGYTDSRNNIYLEQDNLEDEDSTNLQFTSSSHALYDTLENWSSKGVDGKRYLEETAFESECSSLTSDWNSLNMKIGISDSETAADTTKSYRSFDMQAMLDMYERWARDDPEMRTCDSWKSNDTDYNMCEPKSWSLPDESEDERIMDDNHDKWVVGDTEEPVGTHDTRKYDDALGQWAFTEMDDRGAQDISMQKLTSDAVDPWRSDNDTDLRSESGIRLSACYDKVLGSVDDIYLISTPNAPTNERTWTEDQSWRKSAAASITNNQYCYDDWTSTDSNFSALMSDLNMATANNFDVLTINNQDRWMSSSYERLASDNLDQLMAEDVPERQSSLTDLQRTRLEDSGNYFRVSNAIHHSDISDDGFSLEDVSGYQMASEDTTKRVFDYAHSDWMLVDSDKWTANKTSDMRTSDVMDSSWMTLGAVVDDKDTYYNEQSPDIHDQETLYGSIYLGDRFTTLGSTDHGISSYPSGVDDHTSSDHRSENRSVRSPEFKIVISDDHHSYGRVEERSENHTYDNIDHDVSVRQSIDTLQGVTSNVPSKPQPTTADGQIAEEIRHSIKQPNVQPSDDDQVAHSRADNCSTESAGGESGIQGISTDSTAEVRTAWNGSSDSCLTLQAEDKPTSPDNGGVSTSIPVNRSFHEGSSSKSDNADTYESGHLNHQKASTTGEMMTIEVEGSEHENSNRTMVCTTEDNNQADIEHSAAMVLYVEKPEDDVIMGKKNISAVKDEDMLVSDEETKSLLETETVEKIKSSPVKIVEERRDTIFCDSQEELDGAENGDIMSKNTITAANNDGMLVSDEETKSLGGTETVERIKSSPVQNAEERRDIMICDSQEELDGAENGDKMSKNIITAANDEDMLVSDEEPKSREGFKIAFSEVRCDSQDAVDGTEDTETILPPQNVGVMLATTNDSDSHENYLPMQSDFTPITSTPSSLYFKISESCINKTNDGLDFCDGDLEGGDEQTAINGAKSLQLSEAELSSPQHQGSDHKAALQDNDIKAIFPRVSCESIIKCTLSLGGSSDSMDENIVAHNLAQDILQFSSQRIDSDVEMKPGIEDCDKNKTVEVPDELPGGLPKNHKSLTEATQDEAESVSTRYSHSSCQEIGKVFTSQQADHMSNLEKSKEEVECHVLNHSQSVVQASKSNSDGRYVSIKLLEEGSDENIVALNIVNKWSTDVEKVQATSKNIPSVKDQHHMVNIVDHDDRNMDMSGKSKNDDMLLSDTSNATDDNLVTLEIKSSSPPATTTDVTKVDEMIAGYEKQVVVKEENTGACNSDVELKATRTNSLEESTSKPSSGMDESEQISNDTLMSESDQRQIIMSQKYMKIETDNTSSSSSVNDISTLGTHGKTNVLDILGNENDNGLVIPSERQSEEAEITIDVTETVLNSSYATMEEDDDKKFFAGALEANAEEDIHHGSGYFNVQEDNSAAFISPRSLVYSEGDSGYFGEKLESLTHMEEIPENSDLRDPAPNISNLICDDHELAPAVTQEKEVLTISSCPKESGGLSTMISNLAVHITTEHSEGDRFVLTDGTELHRNISNFPDEILCSATSEPTQENTEEISEGMTLQDDKEIHQLSQSASGSSIEVDRSSSRTHSSYFRFYGEDVTLNEDLGSEEGLSEQLKESSVDPESISKKTEGKTEANILESDIETRQEYAHVSNPPPTTSDEVAIHESSILHENVSVPSITTEISVQRSTENEISTAEEGYLQGALESRHWLAGTPTAWSEVSGSDIDRPATEMASSLLDKKEPIPKRSEWKESRVALAKEANATQTQTQGHELSLAGAKETNTVLSEEEGTKTALPLTEVAETETTAVKGAEATATATEEKELTGAEAAAAEGAEAGSKTDWVLEVYKGLCHVLSKPDMPYLG